MSSARRPAFASDLLAVKLTPPVAPVAHVARPALLARLGDPPPAAITLVRAPAGYGKSSLVAHWAVQRAAPTAWVSLDTADNEPTRLWRYVLTACRVFDGQPGKASLAALRRLRGDDVEPLLTTFLNDVQGLAGVHVLVLDDVDALTDAAPLARLSWLIGHLPATLRLILIARQEPALGLSRLRARGAVNELTDADLRFTRDEVREVLARAGRPAGPDDVAAVSAVTRGWPAAVHLQALHPGSTGPAGSPTVLAEFISEEVFAGQPELVREFLVRTAVLPAMTGALCDAVTGRADGAATLQGLERQGLFLESLASLPERRWFRYHPLFAEALQLRAQDLLGPNGIAHVWAAAADWYLRQGQIEQAVNAYFAARLPERAADVLEESLAGAAIQDLRPLAAWQANLPHDLVRTRPYLCFELAQLRLYTSDRYAPATGIAVEAMLRLAETTWQAQNHTGGLGRVAMLRASLAFWQGDLERAVALVQGALPLVADDDANWRGTGLSFTGGQAVLDGRPLDAIPMLLEGFALCELAHNDFARFGVKGFIGMACLLQAELLQAEHHYQELLDEAAAHPAFADDAAHAHLGLAQVLLERNEVGVAEEHLARALAIAEQLQEPQLRRQGGLLAAALAAAQERISSARSRLDALEAGARRADDLREIQAAQTALALLTGDLVAARRWRSGLRALPPAATGLLREREALLLARLALAEGDPGSALDVIHDLSDAAREAGRVRSELELLVWRAAAQAALELGNEAQATLLEALQIAQPRGQRRVFLDGGRPVARILQTLAPRVTDRAIAAFAAGLLRAFPAAAVDAVALSTLALVEPLSPQERRVLRLLSADLSNADIARELVVSPNTIKTQLQSLYRKLGVSSRHDAVATARELDLV